MGDALRFLTVIPAGAATAAPAPRSLIFFPLVGLLVGATWLVPGTALGERAPSAGVVAALVLIVDAAITGGLHLDALADIADGAGSRRSGDEAIAIMRDPTIGALGAVALILVCVLRFAALTVVAQEGLLLLAAPVAGRAAMVALIAAVPPRQDGSLARAFSRPSWPVLAGTAAMAMLAMVPAGWLGFAVLAVALAVTAVYAVWWRRRFGALNGDGVGAGGLIAETGVLLVLTVR